MLNSLCFTGKLASESDVHSTFKIVELVNKNTGIQIVI